MTVVAPPSAEKSSAQNPAVQNPAAQNLASADNFVRRALDPLGPAAAQATAHAVNLGLQALLAAIFGSEIYGPLGLGLIAASTLCFIGEMGYPTLFLREAACRSDWLAAWRRALARRAAGLTLAAVAAVIWRFSAAGWNDPGTLLLLAAGPGIVASAFAPAPLLYGLGAPRRAAATVHFRWAAHGLGGLAAAAFCSAENIGLWMGAVFSIGMLAQIAAAFSPGAAALIPAAAFLPAVFRSKAAFNRDAADHDKAVDTAARRLWIMACLGAAHARALPFLVEATAPALLAPTLFAHQILQGLGGLLGQFDRVTLPQLARFGEDAAAPLRRRNAARLVLWPSAAAAPLLAALATATAVFSPPAWGLTGSAAPVLAAFGGLLLLEWQIQMTGAAMTPIILAKRREAALSAVIVRLTPASLAIQAGLAVGGWLFPALATRVAVTAVIAARAVRLAESKQSRLALASAAATLAGSLGALAWGAVESWWS